MFIETKNSYIWLFQLDSMLGHQNVGNRTHICWKEGVIILFFLLFFLGWEINLTCEDTIFEAVKWVVWDSAKKEKKRKEVVGWSWGSLIIGVEWSWYYWWMYLSPLRVISRGFVSFGLKSFHQVHMLWTYGRLVCYCLIRWDINNALMAH